MRATMRWRVHLSQETIMRTYELSEREAELVFDTVKDRTCSLKNWIAGAVERGDIENAKLMVIKLRTYEKIFAKMNVEAHREIDKIINK
jgi:hypothetical protein